MGKASVNVFRLSGGRGWSVVKGTGPQGSRVQVLGIFPTKEEALAVARRHGKPLTWG
jgi:hypothetical protein